MSEGEGNLRSINRPATKLENVICVDSAYDVDKRTRHTDIVVTGSYCGVLCARFASYYRPAAVIGVDCAIGPEGAAIAGLWYYEALSIPAAAADVMSVRLGDGADVYENGIVSRVNEPAHRCGVVKGMKVREAVELIHMNREKRSLEPSEITNRSVVYSDEDGAIVCSDSIAFALPEDKQRNVLCTGGHTGRSAVPYLLSSFPRGFICSDGGRGRDDSGIAALKIVGEKGLPGAAVDACTARMGDGLSTYHDGVITAANKLAAERGVSEGMRASEAARVLLKLER
ncbi:hypothetical protein [Hyphococcus sp.]|uniref:hypothetical protein n=1 Tax=Hyphococcus sp. TaxID=2038636 RepID=UPI003CCB8D22